MRLDYRDVTEGTVTDIADPERRGRIRATAPALLGDGLELPDWIEPTFPFAGPGCGLFLVPPVGAAVELEHVVGAADDDVPGTAPLLNPQYRWRAGLWRSTADVPEDFLRDYPRRLGLRSPGGATVVLDDAGSRLILKAGTLRLCADNAAEPLVLGEVFLAFMGSFIDYFLGHFHATSGGPSGPPDPATVAGMQALKASDVTGRALVSDESFARKGGP